jgi:transposase
MRPKGSAAELEKRRRGAIELLKKGLPQKEIARRVGASPGSVHRWKIAWEAGGDEALDARPHHGRPPCLSDRDLKRLEKMLLQGAVAWGYSTELWTLSRVAELIEQEFDVSYHPGHVWRILRRMGWSCQKPERRARERDEGAVQVWRQERWPHIKKRPGRRT